MNSTQSSIDAQKRKKLLGLQKEYLEKTVSKLDAMIELSQELEKLDDPELIKAYCDKIDSLDAEVSQDYLIAVNIEGMLQ
jgi:vacuolar-type H+-ATPase subunit E/Vma4